MSACDCRPGPCPWGSFTPRVSMSGEAREWSSIVRRICRTERADRTLMSAAVALCDSTAITSGSMRARRVAVQGSPLRSDRALRARLARVSLVLDDCGVRVRETLTAPRRARIWQLRDGRKSGPSGASRDGDAQAISEVQRIDVLDVQHPTWQVAFRLGRRVEDERAHGDDAA